ncbi:MAG: hypothetical protein IT379_31515, partial [Deltaproteobacteria bacterium]|nr:hypothetical protein [Deltaproteobacteria bacterium]
LGTVVASVARAQECECADDVPDLADRIQRSLIVLEGTVTDVRRDGASWIHRVRVVRVHAGYDLPREVTVSARDRRQSACGTSPLEVGSRYLFLGSELSTLSVSACEPPESMQTIDERLRVEDVISDATAPRAGCASCGIVGAHRGAPRSTRIALAALVAVVVLAGRARRRRRAR